MNTRLLSISGLVITAGAFAVSQFGVSPLGAFQQDEEKRVQEEADEAQAKAVEALERAEVLRGRLRERVALPMAVDIRGIGGGGFSSISVSEANGVKTTTVNENGKQYVIKESAEEVEVAFVKTYGPDDLEALKTDHPDLHMHVVSFPNSTQDGEVSLTVNIKVVRKADDVEALKAAHPDAFEIYEKFSNQQGGIRIRRGFEGVPRALVPLREGLPIEGFKFEDKLPEIRIERDDEKQEDEPAPPRRIIKT